MKRRITNISGITPQLLKPVAGELEKLPGWFNWGRVALFMRGKSALYYGFSSLGLEVGDEVLVPAFICKTVTEPLIRAGAKIRFFNINKDFTVDWNEVQGLISHKTRAVVMYHYLGISVNVRETANFCEKHGLRFIEDAAHALFSTVDGKPAGSIGDAAIISLRKCIPMSFGAALVVNSGDLPLSPPPEYAVALTPEAEMYWQERSKYMHQTGWQNSDTATALDIPLYSSHAIKLTRYFSDETIHSPLDTESLTVMHNTDPVRVKQCRQRNYQIYHNRLRSMSLFTKIDTEASPLGYPVLVNSRNEVQQMLLDEGIETLVHWNRALLPPEIEKKFPEANWLSDNLLTLPVHDQLHEEDIEYVISSLLRILA